MLLFASLPHVLCHVYLPCWLVNHVEFGCKVCVTMVPVFPVQYQATSVHHPVLKFGVLFCTRVLCQFSSSVEACFPVQFGSRARKFCAKTRLVLFPVHGLLHVRRGCGGRVVFSLSCGRDVETSLSDLITCTAVFSMS